MKPVPIDNKVHNRIMKKALSLARKAARRQEVPIAAILMKNNRIIAQAYNLTKTLKDPTAHAEMIVLRDAIKIINNERFLETTLYITLEPCAMCAGAIVQARIPLVIYGADDPKAGACGTVLNVIPNRNLNHRPKLIKGILAEESACLLRGFFRRRR